MRSTTVKGAAGLTAVALALMVALPSAARAATPVMFSHHHVVDVQRLGAEPDIKIDSAGNVYIASPIGVQYAQSFLWKSQDNGETYDLLRAFPPIQRPNPSAGSGDTTLVTLPPAPGQTADAIVWSDMVNLAGLQNAASFDGGNTFPPDYWNQFASEPGADRQWVAALQIPGQATPRVYVWYDEVGPDGDSVIYSDDYGKTWSVGQRGITSGNPGNIAADPVHQKLYATWGAGPAVMVASSDYKADNFKAVTAATGQGSVATLFTVAATDTAGNVYVVYAQTGGNRGVYMVSSTDQGQTWSKPVQVNPVALKDNVFPWIATGDAGRVWVTYYGSHEDKGAANDRGPWNVYASQSLNALDANPTFRTIKVSDHPNHDNEVCLNGIGCTAGQAEDRNMLDDFTSAIDPKGMLHIAYNDTNNQLTQSSDTDSGGAFVMQSRQLSGQSLYNSVGNVVPRPRPPKIDHVSVRGKRLVVAGRDRLKPGNWARDVKGDAPDPRHGSGCPCKNNPAFDLTSTWMATAKKGANKGSLVAHLRINKLPSEAQLLQDSGGKTTVYQVLFWFNNKVYFAQVEVAGQARAWAGQPGFIPNNAGVAKIATYDQDPSLTQTIPFKYTPSKEGTPGKIDMTIPASLVGNPKPGGRLYRVTGFVHTLAGSIGGETLMDERDSASSFFWDFGKPRRADGRVVVSVDDPTFKHSRVVRPGSPGKRWTASLSLARLSKGVHTLYVREAAGPLRSRTVTAHFHN